MLIFFLFSNIIFTTDSASIEVCDANTNDGDGAGSGQCRKVPKGANAEGKPAEVSFAVCEDRHVQCIDYFKKGECTRNPGWMIVNCAHSCNACHLRDPKVRCERNHLNISSIPAYAPGDMNTIFEQMEAKYHERYHVTVHSRSPWVVTFDNFLTDIEIAALLSTVDGTWERSTDTGKANEFGEVGRVLSQGRTSSNAWCRHDCENHPAVKSILRKIEEITDVPIGNYESFQVLKYEKGQKYQVHHDMGMHHNGLACGPRILTFFLYLSDVEEGGETGFPNLHIDVKPQKGKAVLWPSTMDDDPTVQDIRTMHEAKPVVNGLKYGANSWIHLYDFQVPNLWGCTGAFDQL